MTQLDYLEKAVALAKENSGVKIITCVDSQELDSDFMWMTHEIFDVVFTEYGEIDETVYPGFDSYYNALLCRDYELTEEEVRAKIQKAILIKTKSCTFV